MWAIFGIYVRFLGCTIPNQLLSPQEVTKGSTDRSARWMGVDLWKVSILFLVHKQRIEHVSIICHVSVDVIFSCVSKWWVPKNHIGLFAMFATIFCNPKSSWLADSARYGPLLGATRVFVRFWERSRGFLLMETTRNNQTTWTCVLICGLIIDKP